MNRCKYCGKPLTLTPEYDTCMECQGRIMRESTIPQGAFATNSTQPSMNIYDEALVRTKEIYEEYRCAVGIIENALERAKKVEELLGLYRRHINNLCKQEREGVKDSLFSSEFIAYELYEQIKQKEKELEELK